MFCISFFFFFFFFPCLFFCNDRTDSHISYVKLKGTCVKCKKESKKDPSVDSLIKKGDLMWMRDAGQFPVKFHFDCYAPHGRKWGAEKITPGFEEEVGFLRPKDQIRVWELFEGQEERIAGIVVPEGAEEEEEADAAEPKQKKKKESRLLREICF